MALKTCADEAYRHMSKASMGTNALTEHIITDILSYDSNQMLVLTTLGAGLPQWLSVLHGAATAALAERLLLSLQASCWLCGTALCPVPSPRSGP